MADNIFWFLTYVFVHKRSMCKPFTRKLQLSLS
jgi:hypothetical protein